MNVYSFSSKSLVLFLFVVFAFVVLFRLQSH